MVGQALFTVVIGATGLGAFGVARAARAVAAGAAGAAADGAVAAGAGAARAAGGVVERAAGGGALLLYPAYLAQHARDFRLGDLVRQFFPISDYRVNTWKESLREELEKAEDSTKQLISEQIDLIYQEIQSQLQSAKDEVCKQIGEKRQEFTDCVKELDQRSQALQRIQEFFEELLPE